MLRNRRVPAADSAANAPKECANDGGRAPSLSGRHVASEACPQGPHHKTGSASRTIRRFSCSASSPASERKPVALPARGLRHSVRLPRGHPHRRFVHAGSTHAWLSLPVGSVNHSAAPSISDHDTPCCHCLGPGPWACTLKFMCSFLKL